GARPLRRYIAHEVETKIGRALLRGEIKPDGTISVTVDYNRHAARGEDPVLGKKKEWVKPIGSPVAALDLRNFTAGFTLGGLRTSINSEVM
ncbi:hypothetical protein Q5O12_26550, partial [Klebsiella pneumoniae]|uniref:hypothetical protein n=1 Tax=Klebsiella pneumoniae TaxID=573 RepID=UPI00273192AA